MHCPTQLLDGRCWTLGPLGQSCADVCGSSSAVDVEALPLVMATKLFSTEVAGRVVDGCVQLAGGTSIVVGDPLEAAYRRVRQWRFAEGASDLLRIKIAKAVLSGAARL